MSVEPLILPKNFRKPYRYTKLPRVDTAEANAWSK
jgi:hypothetical protein